MKREANQCPDCGAPLPADAPEGLCPKCLMAGAAAPTEAGSATAHGSATPAPTVEEIAAAFPQLQIHGLIGRGGMGFVYRARQPKLERDVALKILPQHLAAHPGFAERFAREGRLLAKLNHPNIVSIFDFGESGGFFYLLMEFVDGVNLRQAMRASRFTAAQALSIVPAICEALQYAHDEGVLHRDIKPENILLDAKGRVKIADFGIAKLMTSGNGGTPAAGSRADEGKPSMDSATAGSESQTPGEKHFVPPSLTAASSTLGTPQYMAPEQIERPSEVDHRADIFSLGVVFYELLTGELPVGKFAPPSAKTPLDERVDEIVLRALAKEREQRQQSARELKTEVETVTTGAGPGQRSPGGTWKPAVGTAPAFGVALYYAGILGGAPLVEALGGGAQGLLTLVVAWGMAVAGFAHRTFGHRDRELSAARRDRLRSWIEGLSVLAMVMCLPVCGFGLFFLGNLIDELTVGNGGWNPALSEAILVPHAISGLGLLPWAAWKLRRSAVTPGSSPRRTSDEQALEETEASPAHQQLVSVFLVGAGFMALLLGMFNPWGPVAWKWFTAVCALGCLVLAFSPGQRHLRVAPVDRPGASQSRRPGGLAFYIVIAGLVGLGIAISLGALARQWEAARTRQAADAAQLTLAQTGLAPVVVETWPVSGARDVEPGIAEIHARFSKPMMDQSWSWSEAWPGSTPEVIQESDLDASGRTFWLKVRLEPGRTYAFWLNSARFTNFKDTHGNTAVPYLLIFETRAVSEVP